MIKIFIPDHSNCLFRKVISKEAKNYVYSEDRAIWAEIYKKDEMVSFVYIMPNIVDVQAINNKVVIVEFSDGTKEKAILSDSDKFSLEQGISICITKKLISMKTEDNGSSIYNKIINRAMKLYNRKMKTISEDEDNKNKELNRINKAKEKKAKRADAAREAQIEIQKEAYLRAMKELNKGD